MSAPGSTRKQTALTDVAMAILQENLESVAFGGNRLTESHTSALRQMVDLMGQYATGSAYGRKAIAIPTGGGKTSAIVAFITALHRQGCDVPLSVAASRVEALCGLYRSLLAQGVPAEKVGLKHSSATASIPSTGDTPYLFQLVTHARVRGGTDLELLVSYKGLPRALCLYDETMLRSEVFFLTDTDLRQAVASLTVLAEDSGDLVLRAAAGFAGACSDAIHAIAVQMKDEPSEQGLAVELPKAQSRAHLEVLHEAIRKKKGRLQHADKLLGMMEAADQPLRVVATQQGTAVVFVTQVLPPALTNVLVLDASTPIRTLVSLDPTIQQVTVPSFKSFEAVEVLQLVAGGGRDSILGSYADTRRGVAPVSKEVIEALQAAEATRPDGSILIYGFLPRKGLDMLERLRADMTAYGLDPDALTINGRRRYVFETWGRHEGLNDYAHCETVVLAGVLHLPHAHIAGAIKGQSDNMDREVSNELINRVVRSEVAHCVYQAASRGSCRVVREGTALSMTLVVISPDATLEASLTPVMPGVRWTYVDPLHLRRGNVSGKRTQMLGRILTYLAGTPDGIDEVASKAVKQGLTIDGAADDKAFTRAGEDLDILEHGWTRKGRTFVRGATAYGFTAVGEEGAFVWQD